MTPVTALAEARRLARQGEAGAAIAACRLAAPERDPAAARVLGLLLAEAGEAEALRWGRHAVGLDRSAESLAALGRMLARLGRWTDASAVLQEALALDPGLTAAQDLLGRAAAGAFAAGQFGSAATAYRTISTLHPHDPAPLHSLGTALHEAGEPAKAIGPYRAALALDGARAETWHNLGSALQATGDLPGALQAYAGAYRLDPACFPRIAQELAAGRAGQVWLSAEALRARLSGPGHDTHPGTLPGAPAPHPPRP